MHKYSVATQRVVTCLSEYGHTPLIRSGDLKLAIHIRQSGTCIAKAIAISAHVHSYMYYSSLIATTHLFHAEFSRDGGFDY